MKPEERELRHFRDGEVRFECRWTGRHRWRPEIEIGVRSCAYL